MSPFWVSKSLAQMTPEEWEMLCDGCGQCCLNKLIDADTDDIYLTNVACDQLDLETCRCKNYDNRFEYEPSCIKLTQANLTTFAWLPKTCAYRLINEKKGLPKWHPLVTIDSELIKKSAILANQIAVTCESAVTDWESHIIYKIS